MISDLQKRQIEAQLDDYDRAIADYAAFMADWRRRNDPAEQRLKRFRRLAAQQEERA